MAGYIRTNTADIQSGTVVKSAPLNAELNAVVAAMHATTGHKHDGTSAEGGPVTQLRDADGDTKINVEESADEDKIRFDIAGTEQLTIEDGGIIPTTTNDIDLGTSSLKFKDAHFSGDVNVGDDLTISDDVLLQSDGAVLKFGTNDEVTLTHVHDTGLLLNGTMALQFNDASQFINAPSATVLDINATDEIELNATLLDVNANLDVSGTGTIAGNTTVGGTFGASGDSTIGGTLGVTGIATFTDDIIIGNGKTIGSASDVDAMTIASTGQITLTQTLIGTALDISGDIDVDGTTNLDAVDIDGAVQVDATVTVGVNDTGYDVKFFGDTASAFMLWDASADDLILSGDAGLVVPEGQFTLGSTAVTADAGEINTLNGITAVVGELNALDLGDTAVGTAIASKAVILDSSKNYTGINNLTTTGNMVVGGTLGVTGATTLAATSFGEANITNVGNIALDSISADGTDIAVAVSDNSATALTIKQGSDAYLIIDTGDGDESVAIGTGVNGTAISIGHTTSETTVNDNLVVTGNLTVSGTTTTVDTTNLAVTDSLLELNSGASTGNDSGIIIQRGSTGNDALIMWDESEGKWTLGTTTSTGTTTGNLNITAGTLVANLEGNVAGVVTGNVKTALIEFTNGDDAITIASGGGITANTSLTLASGSTVTAIKNETNMSSNSNSSLATQSSIKAYVDSIAGSSNNVVGLTASADELNILDCSETTPATVTVADGDGLVFSDGGNGGTLKQITVQSLAAYLDDEITAMPNLITTAATTVGNLDSGSITSNFGTINNGASAITTTGLISGGSLDIDNVLINGTTIGHTDDTDLITLANGVVTIAGELDAATLDISGDIDVNGTTNLDVVDIDGAVNMATTALVTGVLTTTAATVFNGGFAANDGSTITTADNTTQLTLISTDADASVGPVLDLYRNSSGPADNDQTGRIIFSAENDADEKIEYQRIITYMPDVSDGSEDGAFQHYIMKDGTRIQRLEHSPTESVFNQDSADIDFRVESDGNTHGIFVDAGNNKVGIMNSNPNDYYAKDLVVGAADEGGITIASYNTGHAAYLMFADGTSGTARYSGQIGYDHNTNAMQFSTGGTTRTTIDSSGNLTQTANITAFSDRRLKSDIHTVENALEKVEQLRGVTYTRNDIKENGQQLGVIAQEVEEVFPQVVLTADDERGTKSVDYGRLTGALIEAVKELSAKVKELEARLD